MSKTRRTYDAEFKLNAKMLVEESGRTVADVAESLRVGKDMIYRWPHEMKKQGQTAFLGQIKESLAAEQLKIKELHAKIGQLIVERDFLDKAFGR